MTAVRKERDRIIVELIGWPRLVEACPPPAMFVNIDGIMPQAKDQRVGFSQIE